MQQYHSDRRTNRMKYCSDEHHWSNDVSILMQKTLSTSPDSFLGVMLEQEYKLYPTFKTFRHATLYTNITQRDTRHIRRRKCSTNIKIKLLRTYRRVSIVNHDIRADLTESVEEVQEVQEVQEV